MAVVAAEGCSVCVWWRERNRKETGMAVFAVASTSHKSNQRKRGKVLSQASGLEYMKYRTLARTTLDLHHPEQAWLSNC